MGKRPVIESDEHELTIEPQGGHDPGHCHEGTGQDLGHVVQPLSQRGLNLSDGRGR
jgi:hypothetical protein